MKTKKKCTSRSRAFTTNFEIQQQPSKWKNSGINNMISATQQCGLFSVLNISTYNHENHTQRHLYPFLHTFCGTLVGCPLMTSIHKSQYCVLSLFPLAFATEVFLLRHRKTSCGRSFSCPNCKALFGSIESLQTHCRRKGHCFPPEFGAIKTNLKRKLDVVDQEKTELEQKDAKNELFPDASTTAIHSGLQI